MSSFFTMRLGTLLRRPPAWLAEPGEAEDTVVATGVEYKRNLADHSFSGWATGEERSAVLREISQAAETVSALKGGFLAEMKDCPLDARRILVERQLLSRTLAPRQEGCGFALSRKQDISLQINDEEHLTLRVWKHGLSVGEAHSKASGLLAELEASLRFAHNERLGYLMSNPNAVGAGLCVSVILHLPALTMAGMMPQVYAAAEKLNLSVRGIYGDGGEGVGHFYEICNVSPFDEKEDTILDRMKYAARTLSERERGVRYKYATTRFLEFIDPIQRAVGVLNYAMRLGFRETMDNLSYLRMGSIFGLINWSERDREEAAAALPELSQTVSSAYIRVHTVASDLPEGNDVEAMRSFHVRQMLYPALPFGVTLDEEDNS